MYLSFTQDKYIQTRSPKFMMRMSWCADTDVPDSPRNTSFLDSTALGKRLKFIIKFQQSDSFIHTHSQGQKSIYIYSQPDIYWEVFLTSLYQAFYMTFCLFSLAQSERFCSQKRSKTWLITRGCLSFLCPLLSFSSLEKDPLQNALISSKEIMTPLPFLKANHFPKVVKYIYRPTIFKG